MTQTFLQISQSHSRIPHVELYKTRSLVWSQSRRPVKAALRYVEDSVEGQMTEPRWTLRNQTFPPPRQPKPRHTVSVHAACLHTIHTLVFQLLSLSNEKKKMSWTEFLVSIERNVTLRCLLRQAPHPPSSKVQNTSTLGSRQTLLKPPRLSNKLL